ncbi:MAG: hypothetical protein KBS59_04250, partial [Clostridiales bacterium]|nr:hypothetical protein [Clostridiales bacterium]
MFKKLSCVALAICMIFCALCFVGCERTTEIESEERLPVTISVLGITDESTTDEAVKAVEDAINDIMGMTYSTHIDLTLVTADEYMDLVKERQELAEYYSKLDTAVLNYNNKAQSAANEATVTKSFGKWRRKISSVSATTVTTREQYTSIITELNEHGVLEVVYPKAASPIDVVMIIGEDMYKSFDADGVLASVKTQLESETYTKFSQFIYPTYFELLQAMTGDIKAIPNNNLLAEYTYILVNKELADKYELNIDNVKNYSDISDFLASVKAGEAVTPMNTVPEALGIFKLFENDGVAIGTYCDPIIGYNVEESSYYSIRNLF